MPDAALDMEEYASPGRAFARQARMETIILTLMERSMKRFLSEVSTLATKWGAGLSPVAVEDAWRTEIDRVLESPLLSAEAIAYVHDVMVESSLPLEAYNTVVTVMRAANEQHWSKDETSSILRFSLSPDTATAEPVAPINPLTASAELTAAGSSPATKISKARKIKKALDHAQAVAARSEYVSTMLEKAAVAGVSYAGQNWWDKVKQEARNAVTGLDGHLTQNVLTSFVQQYETSAPETKKRWVTKRDKKVRETHNHADGQTVPVNESFIVGGAFMMYPGDRTAPVEETANCRCVMVAVGPRLRDAKGRFMAIPIPNESRAATEARERKRQAAASLDWGITPPSAKITGRSRPAGS